MSDCRTCKHNSYLPEIKDWVNCSHPVTLSKRPKVETQDPAFVNWMTSDLRAIDIADIGPCPTFEPLSQKPKEPTHDQQ